MLKKSNQNEKTQIYNAIDISRYIINYSDTMDYSISNLKLQKLLYFVQSYFIVTFNRKCFSDVIEAWDFGVVVPNVYREFKMYGCGEIPRIKFYYVFDENVLWNIRKKEYDDKIIKRRDKKHINKIVDLFADYTATDLLELTCNQSPWKNAYERNKHNEISIESIKEFFYLTNK